MTKKIDILGLSLDNYTVRESITQAEAFLENGTLSTIEMISVQTLLAAAENPAVRGVIEALDLSVIGEREILQAVGIDTMQRLRETDESDFSTEFFKRLERNKKSVFLLGQDADALTQVRGRLADAFPRLVIVGECALENCTGDPDGVINDMNAMTPDVIVSVLPTPAQEEFFRTHRNKMSVSIWYGAGECGLGRGKKGIAGFFARLASRLKLQGSMEKYRRMQHGSIE